MKVIDFESREKLVLSAIELIKAELQNKSDKLHGIMLSGGSTPLAIYKKIAESPFSVDGNSVITYSDERDVPSDDNESNFYHTQKMLKALKIKEGRIIRVRTELQLTDAATCFHEDLFDLISNGSVPLGLLGMGADGHTASLFTLQNVEEGKGKMAIAVTKENPPHRISVTKDFIDHCQKIVLLLTGAEKKEILKVLVEKPDTIPAGKVLKNHPNVEVWVSK